MKKIHRERDKLWYARVGFSWYDRIKTIEVVSGAAAASGVSILPSEIPFSTADYIYVGGFSKRNEAIEWLQRVNNYLHYVFTVGKNINFKTWVYQRERFERIGRCY